MSKGLEFHNLKLMNGDGKRFWIKNLLFLVTMGRQRERSWRDSLPETFRCLDKEKRVSTSS